MLHVSILKLTRLLALMARTSPCQVMLHVCVFSIIARCCVVIERASVLEKHSHHETKQLCHSLHSVTMVADPKHFDYNKKAHLPRCVTQTTLVLPDHRIFWNGSNHFVDAFCYLHSDWQPTNVTGTIGFVEGLVCTAGIFKLQKRARHTILSRPDYHISVTDETALVMDYAVGNPIDRPKM